MNISGDAGKLDRDFGIKMKGKVELDSLARQVDAENPTLAKTGRRRTTLNAIVGMYTGRSLDKGSVRISNWENELDEKQMACEWGWHTWRTARLD